MSPKIIEQVYKIVDLSDFQHRDRLLGIAARWRDFNFSMIVQDHNFFGKTKKAPLEKPMAH